MHYGEIYEAIDSAEPNSKIRAALNDDPLGAGIIDESGSGFVGSRIYNVATAAMNSLREQPDDPVIEHSISIPEQEDWLSRFTLKVLNDSLVRPYSNTNLYRYESRNGETVNAGPEAEKQFIDSAGISDYDPENDSLYEEDNPPLLLIDFIARQAMPIAFKKHIGDPVTIFFKPTQINSVRYPGATLYNMRESGDIVVHELDGIDIARIDKKSIDSIVPIRFSAFSFKPEDREAAMTPITGYEIPPELMSTFVLKSVGDIVNSFPNPKSLATIYSNITRQERQLAQ